MQEQQAAIEATSEREAGGAIGRLGPAGAQIVPEGTPPGAAGAAADAADAAEAGSASYGGASTVAAAASAAAAASPAPAPAPAPITLLVAPAPEHAQLADREAARERELSLTKLQVSA
eukprot:COSAG01_NODE_732_length_13996_cov_33.626322_4_plen_118_part_00